MNLWKKIYTRIFPASKYQVNALRDEIRNYRKVLQVNQNRVEKILQNQTAEYSKLAENAELLKKILQGQSENIQEALHKEAKELQKIIETRAEHTDVKFAGAMQTITARSDKISSNMEAVTTNGYKVFANSNEILWACVFHDAISKSSWLMNQTFYPGRWAIGYPGLYVLYRILNEIKPKRILELGLGQSTRMITQYAASQNEVEHYVVEHDEEWIRFFERSALVSENTKLVKLDREMSVFLDAKAVRKFQGFRERFENHQFDLIFIDAPLGGDMKQYARVDILSVLPQCLQESFVILMDDYHRTGERNTGQILENRLKDHKISFVKGIYAGQKEVGLWASEDYAFLSTM